MQQHAVSFVVGDHWLRASTAIVWVPPQVEEGTFRFEFPDIFRTLILNREIMPGGRGKRLRVRGDVTGIVANIQANQASYLWIFTNTPGINTSSID